jgi:hypothetical protein
METQICYIKECSHKGNEQPITNFSKSSRRKSGFRGDCKDCNKKYREDNKDRIHSYLKEYQKENKEDLKISSKISYRKRKPKILVQKKEYRKNNLEMIREKDRNRINKKERDVWITNYFSTKEGKHARRLSELKRKFKIDEKWYLDKLEEQGRGCGICGSDDPGVSHRYVLFVDHDHKCCAPGDRNNRGDTCGKCLRGLLCSPCNIRLGLIEKRGRLDLASKAELKYLKKYNLKEK